MPQNTQPENTSNSPRKICYVLAYYSPRYVRTISLVDALNQLPDVTVLEARNSNPGLLRYVETLWRLLKIRLKHDPDTYIIGFRGHEIYFLARLIIGPKRLIIFDEFVSPYDSFVHERNVLAPRSGLARLLHTVEKRILQSADRLLADTKSQANAYARTFDIDPAKFHPVAVGVDETIFTPDGPAHDYATDEFVVFTYATFLPLHGIDIILEAANRLRNYPIRFVIAGGKGTALDEFAATIQNQGLCNIDHIPWIPFDRLPHYIRGANLCLGGPFGNTPQAKRVITGKSIQFFACGKTTVVGQGDETQQLTHQEDCILVPQGNAQALSDAILWAYEHHDRLDDIGSRARRTFLAHYSKDQIIRQLESALR